MATHSMVLGLMKRAQPFKVMKTNNVNCFKSFIEPKSSSSFSHMKRLSSSSTSLILSTVETGNIRPEQIFAVSTSRGSHYDYQFQWRNAIAAAVTSLVTAFVATNGYKKTDCCGIVGVVGKPSKNYDAR